ncbi:hypothetical protein [Sphingobacterium multivorum]|uniref:hypothetical protein n=1 Tax=Sphingobacterium multivorum TaxID=28454 RepID=UPI00289D6C8C|nr:hypothetical protein [Sphingobacterium multivorum]
MKKITFSIDQFESITETAGHKFIGGFSMAYGNDPDDTDDGGVTNNCDGGNCKSSCGTGQNIQCNTVANCAG